MKYLISLNEFVITIKDIENDKFKQLVLNYTNFLNKKPLLEYFIPCDEEGNVLEEPKLPYDKPTWCDKCAELNPEYSKWYKAQSTLLFKGWVVGHVDTNEVEIRNGRFYLLFINGKTTGTLEVCIGEELTETALKQIL